MSEIGAPIPAEPAKPAVPAPVPTNPPPTDPSPNAALEYPYGALNDVSKPMVRKRFSMESGHTFQAMVEAAADFYTPDALKNVGAFKGIVLRVKDKTSPGVEPGTWFSNFFDALTSDSPPQVVEIKVRVPEIHAMLPIPSQLGSEPGPHQKIIEMYPTFVAQSTLVEAPKPGDLVWVDWGNRQNWTDPFYIRPVKEEGPIAGGLGGAGNGWGSCGGTYRATGGSGDAMAGKNKTSSHHQGIPQLNRTFSN